MVKCDIEGCDRQFQNNHGLSMHKTLTHGEKATGRTRDLTKQREYNRAYAARKKANGTGNGNGSLVLRELDHSGDRIVMVDESTGDVWVAKKAVFSD
jgi:hypothetical protein